MLGATAVSIAAVAIHDRRASVRSLLVSGAGFAGFERDPGRGDRRDRRMGSICGPGVRVEAAIPARRVHVRVGLVDRIDRVLNRPDTDLRSVVQLGAMATPLVVAAVLLWGCWRNRQTADPRFLVLVGSRAPDLQVCFRVRA